MMIFKMLFELVSKFLLKILTMLVSKTTPCRGGGGVIEV